MSTFKFIHRHFDPPKKHCFCTVSAYRMVSVRPVNDNNDPEVDVNAMIAEVGAELVSTVQGHVLKGKPLELRDRMHPANNLLAHCMNSCLVCPPKALIMCLRQIPMVPLLVRRHAPAM